MPLGGIAGQWAYLRFGVADVLLSEGDFVDIELLLSQLVLALLVLFALLQELLHAPFE